MMEFLNIYIYIYYRKGKLLRSMDNKANLLMDWKPNIFFELIIIIILVLIIGYSVV